MSRIRIIWTSIIVVCLTQMSFASQAQAETQNNLALPDWTKNLPGMGDGFELPGMGNLPGSPGFELPGANLPGVTAPGGEEDRSLEFKVYVPQNPNKSNERSLIVLLHGCTQTADDMAIITSYNKLAEQENIVVLYPQQSRIANPNVCWNWFEQRHQVRGRGEPAKIVTLARKAMAKYQIKKERVFLVGFSAGGGMANILANCYPDLFSRVVSHSGLNYQAATSMIQAFTAMKQGSQTPIDQAARKGFQCGGSRVRQPISMLAIHGDRDNIVTPVYLGQQMSQISKLNDLLDDGRPNQSYKLGPVKEHDGQTKGGMRYSFKMRDAGNSQLAILSVTGMGHAWSGGAASKPFSEPRGPNATQISWWFLNSPEKL